MFEDNLQMRKRSDIREDNEVEYASDLELLFRNSQLVCA